MRRSLAQPEVQIATMSRRVAAGTIDTAILCLISFAIANNLYQTIAPTCLDVSCALLAPSYVAYVSSYFIIKLLYNTLSVWIFGRTIGQYLSNIHVVNISSCQRLSLRASLLRAIAMLIPLQYYSPENNAKSLIAYDVIAKSIVIKRQDPSDFRAIGCPMTDRLNQAEPQPDAHMLKIPSRTKVHLLIFGILEIICIALGFILASVVDALRGLH